MALILNYTKEAYKSKMDRLNDLYLHLGTHLDKMEEYKSQIRKFWRDSNGVAMAEVINEEILQIRNAQRRTKDMYDFYERTMENLDRTNNAADTILSGAFDLIKSLGISDS